mgnify:CR=1 FL=1
MYFSYERSCYILNVHTRINKHRAKRETLINEKLVKPNIYYENNNLYKFDIVIGSHQSAAHLDAYLAGFPVIIYLPDGDLNLSPLRGIHKIPIVNNRKTLIGALRSIHNGREGPKDCFFWLDKNLIKWRKAIKQITKN